MRGCLVRWILPVFVCAGSLTAQAPQINAVLNGASFDQSAQAPPVAPGSIVSIFGAALAGTASTPVSMDASMNIPLETSLGGPSRNSALSPVSVSFDGVNAPLFALIRTATFDQINAQIPWGVDVTDGKVQVVVTRGGQAGPAVEFPAADASPGIFTLQFGPGPAIVTNVAFAGGPAVVNGSFAQPQGSVCTTLGLPPGCGVADEPAPVGGAVTIWSNGLGPVDVQVASGNIPTTVGPGGFVAAVKPVRVFIGGVQAQVIGAALHSQFVALNQINVIVPNVPAGNAVPVRIEMDLNPGGTVRSRGDATMAVRAAP